MESKTERPMPPTSTTSQIWHGRWWTSADAFRIYDRYHMILSAPGSELRLMLDREQFDQLLDKMCEVAHTRDCDELDKQPEPEIQIQRGPNLS